ncbi:MAG TPA: sugar ABC transporter permease [Clostridiales bacterium]|nr:sugar ABC transporter permease [Clostridiales bacterium]
MKKLKLSMEKRNMVEGYIFISPFLLGTLIFFAFPLFMSIKLSFGKILKMEGFKIKWIGIDNYVRAFLVDINFVPMFINVVKQTFIKVLLIIIFSLLLSILINKNIKFRGFFRTVFFIPFLLGTGDVMKQLLGQGVDKQVISLADGTLIPRGMLAYLGTNVVTVIDVLFSIIVVVLWSSGVQILLFLSGLQTIPISLYESSKVDGATEWEMFWKITLPMISPIMLLNIIYTLVDSFTDVTNPILSYIQNTAFINLNFEYAAAMGWIYLLFIFILVLLVMRVLKSYTHMDDVKGVNKNAKRND